MDELIDLFPIIAVNKRRDGEPNPEPLNRMTEERRLFISLLSQK